MTETTRSEEQPCTSYHKNFTRASSERIDRCDSEDDTSSLSDRSTPHQWARDLKYVLKDYEGYQLFKKFLENELGHANELLFWYACKGMKKKYLEHQKETYENDDKRQDAEKQWSQYVRTFYHDYIVHDSRIYLPSIRLETRQEVLKLLTENDRLFDLVDLVQKEVEDTLRTRHAQFVESDDYIQYLQTPDGNELPEDTESVSVPITSDVLENTLTTSTVSLNDVLRPPSGLLFTVPEESEAECSIVPSPPSTRCHTLPARASAAHSSTDSNLPSAFKQKRSLPPVVQLALDETPKLTQNTLKKTYQHRIQNTNGFVPKPDEPPHPYHTPYKPHLTTSTQDSERQSMSSGTNTESSVSGAVFQHKDRHAMRSCANNRELHRPIPRTKRQQMVPPQIQNQNMTNESFRKKVCSKLEELKQQLDFHRTVKENPKKAMQNYWDSIHKSSKNANNEVDILDNHMSNLGPGWKESPKHSPMRSPGVGQRRGRSPQSQTASSNVINRIMTRGISSFLPVSVRHPHHQAAAQNSPAGQQVRPNCLQPQARIDSQYQQHQKQSGENTGILLIDRPVRLASFESEMAHKSTSNFGPTSRYTNNDDTSGFWSGVGSSYSDASQNPFQKGESRTIHNVTSAGTAASSKLSFPTASNKRLIDTDVHGSTHDPNQISLPLQNPKFFFKTEQPGFGEIYNEIVTDDEELPLFKPNEITARVDF